HIIINEVGSNVVASYTGSLNVDDATDYPVSTFLSDRGIAPDAAWIANGLGSVDAYALTNGVFNFGPGSSRTANSNTGDLFGVENSAGNQRLMLPDGYVSGTILTGRLTFNSQT